MRREKPTTQVGSFFAVEAPKKVRRETKRQQRAGIPPCTTEVQTSPTVGYVSEGHSSLPEKVNQVDMGDVGDVL